MGDEGTSKIRMSPADALAWVVRSIKMGKPDNAVAILRDLVPQLTELTERADDLLRQRDGLRETIEETHIFLNNWLGDFGDQGGRIVRRLKEIDTALAACEPASVPALAGKESDR